MPLSRTVVEFYAPLGPLDLTRIILSITTSTAHHLASYSLVARHTCEYASVASLRSTELTHILVVSRRKPMNNPG